VLSRYGAAAPWNGIQDRHTSATAQPKDEQAAIFQLCANRALILALQPAFQDGAVSLRGSVQKHRHLAGGSYGSGKIKTCPTRMRSVAKRLRLFRSARATS